MVSALWKACAAEAEDVAEVERLLSEPGVDLEIKDQAGTTPLIQAVKNGHKDVVKALLAAGVDPHNPSNQGRPETYTNDPEMLALLQPKQQLVEGFQPPQQQQDPNAPYNPAMHPYYYPVPPGHEGPYPPYPYPMLSPPDGQPPVHGFPPATDGTSPGGVPNLPPADVARTIPCRYFPVCRYGSSCMFLHPQPPYFSGPPPPAPAHYPTMYPPPHGYYMMRPGQYPPPPPPGAPPVDSVASPVAGNQPFPPPAPLPFPPPPNSAPPFSPVTNGAPFPPPPVNGGVPFPNGAPYPPQPNGAPYPPPPPTANGTPYTPISAGTPSPFGPPPFSPGSATPYSAGAPFTPGPVPAPYGFAQPYPNTPKDAPPTVPNGPVGDENSQVVPPAPGPPMANGINGTGNHPNGGYVRRAPRGGRRESFGTGGRTKPPCLFFPSGRCRNGDDCRFPHIMPEPGSQPAPFRYPPSNNHHHNNHNGPNGNNGGPNNNNGRYHRSRPSVSHHDGPPPVHIPPGTKLPFAPNGHLANEQQQRVPSADDFPVLRASGNGVGGERATAVNGVNGGGMTAAQVLQAPPPVKKGKVEDGVNELADAFSKVHVNGITAPAFDATPTTTPEITAVGA
ncbi:hypothetical protein FRC07_006035 [Ceratobasidium sp. 392]|nr:hypothetical protein FRC07_006035 [Ceratobasidium sp. 392]